jgi:hypothetical protein
MADTTTEQRRDIPPPYPYVPDDRDRWVAVMYSTGATDNERLVEPWPDERAAGNDGLDFDPRGVCVVRRTARPRPSDPQDVDADWIIPGTALAVDCASDHWCRTEGDLLPHWQAAVQTAATLNLGATAPPARDPQRPRTRYRINPASGGVIVKVGRACDGCGVMLGDVTDEEVAAALANAPMPGGAFCVPCQGR